MERFAHMTIPFPEKKDYDSYKIGEGHIRLYKNGYTDATMVYEGDNEFYTIVEGRLPDLKNIDEEQD